MFTGTSGSLLLHPREFIESRNEADAMLGYRAGYNQIEATGVEGLGWTEACFALEHTKMVERQPGVPKKLFEEPQQATHDIRALVRARQAAEEGLPCAAGWMQFSPRSEQKAVWLDVP